MDHEAAKRYGSGLSVPLENQDWKQQSAGQSYNSELVTSDLSFPSSTTARRGCITTITATTTRT